MRKKDCVFSADEGQFGQGLRLCRVCCSLYSRQSDGAFLLRERKPTEEKLACPDCGFEGTLALAPSMVALLILNAPNAIRCIEPFVERKT